jgi:hypothetical protein
MRIFKKTFILSLAPMDIHCLPDEIMVSILLDINRNWIDVEQCVCERWYQLVDDFRKANDFEHQWVDYMVQRLERVAEHAEILRNDALIRWVACRRKDALEGVFLGAAFRGDFEALSEYFRRGYEKGPLSRYGAGRYLESSDLCKAISYRAALYGQLDFLKSIYTKSRSFKLQHYEDPETEDEKHEWFVGYCSYNTESALEGAIHGSQANVLDAFITDDGFQNPLKKAFETAARRGNIEMLNRWVVHRSSPFHEGEYSDLLILLRAESGLDEQVIPWMERHKRLFSRYTW